MTNPDKEPFPALKQIFSGVFNDYDASVHIDVLVQHQVDDDLLARAKYEFQNLRTIAGEMAEALAGWHNAYNYNSSESDMFAQCTDADYTSEAVLTKYKNLTGA